MYTLSRWLMSVGVLTYILSAHAEIDINSLVKVTNDNNPKCVEYYNYLGALYCSTSAQAPDHKIDPQIRLYETQKIVFDNRPWQAGWGKKTDKITTVEYVPAGDNVEQWTELITSQFIPGIQNQTTPKQFMENVIQNLHESGFKPIIKTLEEGPDQVIFDFRIEEPSNMQQDELQMITKGKDGMYILHYVIKKADMGEKNREKWLQLLKKSKITE